MRRSPEFPMGRELPMPAAQNVPMRARIGHIFQGLLEMTKLDPTKRGKKITRKRSKISMMQKR